ncbi:MAG: hypothetical protein Tsb0019_10000 [Roseibium sp.]
MARLEKYKGAQRLADIRRPQVAADTAVGEATAGLGRQVRQSAGRAAQLGQLLKKRQAQIDRFETQRALRKIDQGVKQREREQLQSLAPGAGGFTEAMLGFLESEAADAEEMLPGHMRARVREELGSRSAAYSMRFAAIEHAERQRYFRTGLAEAAEMLRAGVEARPEAVDEAVAELAGLIDSSALPEDERAALALSGATAIREAWVRTLPPRYRLSLFRALDTEDVEPGSVAERPLPEDVERVKDLPRHTVRRLSVEARDAIAVSVLEEEDRIAAQITSQRSGFDPKAIERSHVLPADGKSRLQALLKAELSREEDELAALDWAGKAISSDAASAADLRRADRAYQRMTQKGAEPDAVARSVLQIKKLLPPAYASGLRNYLESMDPATVGKAHETLADLYRSEPAALQAGPLGGALSDSRTRWRIFTELRGMSAEEASSNLAAANDPGRRLSLEDRYLSRAVVRETADARAILTLLAGHRPFREVD